jgi:phosphonate ABC transporter substrate-binding protein
MQLTTVTRTQGNNQPLKDGTVKPKTFEFDFIEVPVLIDAFRRMVRAREFDICELAITTYVCAKEHGKRFTALPIFLGRAFHHAAVLCHSKSDIRSPKDLEGRKVGVGRGYTVTTGLWARAMLQDEHGVDLNKVTWALTGDEHVIEYVPPPNVVSLPPGMTLEDALLSGEVAAVIVGLEKIDHPDVKPLIANARDAGVAALRARGHYPINHLMVVKDELLEAHPQLAADVFDAFARAKHVYLARLASGAIHNPTDVDRVHQRVMEITGDPLPYGIEPNRHMLEEFVDHALTQRIIRKRVTPEELFAPSTRDLIG